MFGDSKTTDLVLSRNGKSDIDNEMGPNEGVTLGSSLKGLKEMVIYII
jgi:hypothetical protein